VWDGFVSGYKPAAGVFQTF